MSDHWYQLRLLRFETNAVLSALTERDKIVSQINERNRDIIMIDLKAVETDLLKALEQLREVMDECKE